MTNGSIQRRISTMNMENHVSLTSLQAIDAEIRQLEAQKALLENRDTEVPAALAVLQRYAEVLTAAQRRQIAKLVEAEISASAPRAPREGKADGRRGGKRGPVPPKYQLPTGELWTGRGRTPTPFAAWEKSAEGKAWAKAHEGERFPAAPGAAAAVRAKPAAKRGGKKQGGRPGRKRARAKG